MTECSANFQSRISPAEPRTWILASPHAGDNTQLLALAGALGWPYEIKRLRYRPVEKLLRFAGLATLSGVELSASDPISAPYPDLVIAAGRSAEAVCFWIRAFANPLVKLVFVGTPWASPERFDLVIATPQYRLAPHPHVLLNELPMHALHPGLLEEVAAIWRTHFDHLPRPWIAVLVGGDSGPYLFSAASAVRLGREASQMAKELGGSLLVTTSARTSPEVADALSAAIDVPHFFHRWTASARDNPINAFFGLAHKIIVTADSVSMIAEASAAEKPLYLFDIEAGRQSMRAEERAAKAGGPLAPPYWRGRSLGSTAFRLAMRFAPPRWSRDLRIVHRNVMEAGLANWLGEKPRAGATRRPPGDLSRAVARVRALFPQ